MEDLKVFTTVDSLQEWLSLIDENDKVSLVPTMGALHHGHIELVNQAFTMSNIVVVSIFVNPIQFNKKEDLINYPRTFENDLKLIKEAGDVIVFAPSDSDMYPSDFKEVDLDLGILEEVMEGEFRPGHFKGVMNVVKRLFDIVHPDYALFGLKDYQQLAVIEFMTNSLNLPVNVVPCETVREESGLASSSRNKRLSDSEMKAAEIIIETMKYAKKMAGQYSPKEVTELAKKYFSKGNLELEYLNIVDPQTLLVLNDWVPGSRICMSAYCSGVRLIDNIELLEKELVS
jgi:pantoate--beta-alanine ligase